MFSVVRRGRESVERSDTARGASLNVGRSHRCKTVERIIFAASGASGGNTRLAASASWSLSHRHPAKRGRQLSAGHPVNVPATPVVTWGAFSFALSLSCCAGPAEEP